MNNYKAELPIFFAVDDGYIPFLAVTIQSIVENATKDYKYLIKVLYTNVYEKNKESIKKYETENIKIEFVISWRIHW